LIRLDQRCDGGIQQLILSLLLGPEAVPIMRLLTQSERPKQRDNFTQPFLQDDNCSNKPLLETQAKVDFSKVLAGALNVVGILDDSIDQILLSRKSPEDCAFGNTGRLRDLPGAHLTTETLK